MTRKIAAVIPASGVGSRMNAPLPKQYLMLQGKTILEHALTPFIEQAEITQVVVAVSPTDSYYSQLPLLKHPKVKIVFGGETRAESVFNALQSVEPESWVLVHDAARPCLCKADLKALLTIDDPNGAILAIPAVDTMKRAKGQHIVATEDRSTLWHALTPQFFPAGVLCKALQSAFQQGIIVTDEASAMEHFGYTPRLVAGRSDNLKVTRPEDLALAKFYLMERENDENRTRF